MSYTAATSPAAVLHVMCITVLFQNRGFSVHLTHFFALGRAGRVLMAGQDRLTRPSVRLSACLCMHVCVCMYAQNYATCELIIACIWCCLSIAPTTISSASTTTSARARLGTEQAGIPIV